MGWERGPDAVNKAVERQSGDFGPRLSFFTWKDGDKKFLRFLEDDLPLVGDFAQQIVTNQEKVQTMDFLIGDTNWVEKFHGRQREWGTGNLVAPKLRKLGVGIAVERQEIPDPDNPGRVKLIDKVSTKEVDGKKYEALTYGIVKLPPKTFWKKLTGMQRRYGTLCDRDYQIERIGGDKDTDYEVTPIDSDSDELRDPDKVRELYGYGHKYDEKDPKRFTKCPKTLDEWAQDYSSEERARFWLEGASSPMTNGNGAPHVDGLNEFGAETTSNPEPTPAGWGSTGDDEAQPVVSSASNFSGVRDQLRQHFANHPTD
jgi:hypothetical protein